MWYIHATAYYSAIRRNRVLAHAATQMALETLNLPFEFLEKTKAAAEKP